MSCNQFVELLPGQGEITDKAEDVCPVDWALKIADKARLNNCGKSVMCRDGMNQMYTIILDITTEKGRPKDVELLRDICTVIKESQGCDIAAKAAMLIDESIRLYGEEWDAHTRRKRCTALVCEKYYTVHILTEKCRVFPSTCKSMSMLLSVRLLTPYLKALSMKGINSLGAMRSGCSLSVRLQLIVVFSLSLNCCSST